MRSRHLTVLLAMIALAVGAVTAAQFYWIYNAYKLQAQNFDNGVQQSIKQTATFLENNYSCLEAVNRINMDSLQDLVILQRSVNKQGVRVLDTVKQFTSSFSPDSFISYRDMTAPFPMTAEIDIKYHYTPVDKNCSLADLNRHNQLSRFNKKDQRQFFRGKYDITYVDGGSFFTHYMDSLLRVYLKKAGIESQFYFQVKDTDNGKTVLKNFKNIKQLAGAKPFRTVMFGQSYFFKPEELQLWMPQQNRYLLGKMWVVLIGSFSVLLLLGVVVWVAARTLLRQKKLSDMKNDFISNMTHEFKTPIANISLALDTIDNLRLLNGANNIKNYLSIIGSENSRMAENVERILQISIIKKEHVQLKLDSIHLEALIQNVIRCFELVVLQKGGEICTELKLKNPMVRADATHLSNTLYNLLDNAVKYNQTAPLIRISATDHEDEIIISVKDNGIGIPEQEQQYIFDRFYRVPTGNKHDVKGFGLGLSYVRDIVEAHGGEVRVRSRLEEGAEFNIFLPRDAQQRAGIHHVRRKPIEL